jgi:hypothetical protein
MTQLEEIIRNECLPAGDCMLTVQDINGEAGFLYFKEGELIEANFAALWGKEAVGQLTSWQIAEHTVTPLPLGIKRSLWDSLEVLLNPNADPTSVAPLKPQFQAQQKKESAPTPWDEFKELPGVIKIVLVRDTKSEVVFEAEGEFSHSTEYMADFVTRSRSVGDTLGMGKLDRWTLNTDRYQVVGLRVESGSLAILRRHDVDLDDFESAVAATRF